MTKKGSMTGMEVEKQKVNMSKRPYNMTMHGSVYQRPSTTNVRPLPEA